MKNPKIPWIGTGWKMNKLRADAVAFANTLRASVVANAASAQTFVLPPFPYIAEVADILKDTRVKVGAQISATIAPSSLIATRSARFAASAAAALSIRQS